MLSNRPHRPRLQRRRNMPRMWCQRPCTKGLPKENLFPLRQNGTYYLGMRKLHTKPTEFQCLACTTKLGSRNTYPFTEPQRLPQPTGVTRQRSKHTKNHSQQPRRTNSRSPPQQQMETEDSTELVTTEIAQHSTDTIPKETTSKIKQSSGDTTEPKTKENTTTDESGTNRTPPRDTEPTNDPGKETTPKDKDTEKQPTQQQTKTRTEESPQTEHHEQDSTDSDSTITGSDNEEEYHQNELLTLRTENSKRDLRHSPQRIKKRARREPIIAPWRSRMFKLPP